MTLATKSDRYIKTIGRRKTSIATLRMTPAAKQSFTINDREFEVYFPTEFLRATVLAPFRKLDPQPKFKATVRISGGGISSQAIALRHAIARALIIHDIELRATLKKDGYLKRDSRAKERRKFGLKKARKAPQWSKR
ncbi:MAG: 30S ribosomal protein S9 [Candidatus Taylorbacteria bacterium RIFCSPHIGHO2_01_FULL_46_22b]|uniref:30S ribosomal protein S9 n=1 Tax=Candidatus Taylorbacteria bacterium RIFCSPHIGHO2_01_FULL_46_22b TaxID=1802301 RepID=A0A1G2M3G6_9BACT|nr:MAG: 30S ribosomal protein S9 [Candidatus Taylorbacteria bacterium RIFCSPHIGHO2_01_FULL_46_22b]